MGLPLFVAPVESDLSNKAAPKHRSSSPSRSAIRRTRPDARHAARRAAVRVFGLSQAGLPPTAAQGRIPVPFVETDLSLELAQMNSAESPSRPFREALREMTGIDNRRRDILEEQMSSIFSGSWHDIAQGPPPPREEEEERDLDLGWWSLEPRPRARRARVLPPPSSSRPNHSPHRSRLHNAGSPPFPMIARAQPLSAMIQDESPRSMSAVTQGAIRRHQSRLLRNLSNRRHLSGRRANGVDGLGDRNRSLSPEVWDTLLTTLTPDPQPPSVGSSFASGTAAPPPVGLPPGAPLSTQMQAEESALDGACESGCENSDTEDAEYEHPDYRQIRHRRERLGHADGRVPDYNLDGPSEGPFVWNGRSVDRESTPRQPRHPDGPISEEPPPFVEDTALHASIARLQAQRNAFAAAGRTSTGGSEDEQRGADARSQHTREDSTGPGHSSAYAGDEDWLGMQRIVRSLAAREDIPDEWWAEAGLSRTFP